MICTYLPVSCPQIVMTSQTELAGTTGFGGGASALPFLEQLRAEQLLPIPHVPVSENSKVNYQSLI